MKESRFDFFCFFSGSSSIGCMVVRVLTPVCELRRCGGGGGGNIVSADFRRPSFLFWSLLFLDSVANGCRLVDSLSALGRFTASTSSVTELVAISFCLAARFHHKIRMWILFKAVCEEMQKGVPSYRIKDSGNPLGLSVFSLVPSVCLLTSTCILCIIHTKNKSN